MDDTTLEQTGIVLVVGNERLSCNRATLAQTSRYFRAMFSSRMKESLQEEVELKGVSVDGAKLLVRYLQGEHIEVEEENVHALVEAACMYQVDSISSKCCSYLDQHLCDANCLSTMQLADSYFLNKIYNKSKRHTLWYFTTVSETEEFLELNKSQVVQYLSEETLNVDSELSIFRAAERWIQHRLAVRTDDIQEVMACVRVEFMTAQEQEVVQSAEIVKPYADYLLKKVPVQKTTTKRGRCVPRILLTVGGVMVTNKGDLVTHSQEICQLNVDTGALVPYTDLRPIYPVQCHDMGYRVCVVGKDLYVMGGEAVLGRNSWCMDVWRYDSFAARWDTVTRLTQPRRHHAVCVMGESIYLIGGFGKFRILLKSVEEYSCKTGEWRTLAPLLTPEISPGAVSFRGKLYVMKGHVQCYCPTTDAWTLIRSHSATPLDIPVVDQFAPCDAVACGDVLYTCCIYHASSLIKYDPSHGTWEKVAEFPKARGKVALIDGKIYRTGGEGSRLMECFDIESRAVSCILECKDTEVKDEAIIAIPKYPDFVLKTNN